MYPNFNATSKNYAEPKHAKGWLIPVYIICIHVHRQGNQYHTNHHSNVDDPQPLMRVNQFLALYNRCTSVALSSLL